MPAGQTDSYDVAVVGAGVFGAWTALTLRKAGASVVLLDAYGPAHARASSGGESRIIRMGYGPDEIYTRWSLNALPLWQELLAEAGRPELFQRTGVLWTADERERATYAHDTVETLAKFRVPHEKLTNGELRRRYPQIEFDNTSWGIFEPSSGVLMARRAVQAVVDQAQRIGITYKIAIAAPPVPSNVSGRRVQKLAIANGETISLVNSSSHVGLGFRRYSPLCLRSASSSRARRFFSSASRPATPASSRRQCLRGFSCATNFTACPISKIAASKLQMIATAHWSIPTRNHASRLPKRFSPRRNL